MSHLKGKTVLVTGATGGIGAATCRLFDSLGAKILLLGRDETKLENIKGSLSNSGHVSFIGDAQKINELNKIAADIDDQSPDIAIHAMGGTLGFREIESSHQEWQQVFNVNLHAIVSLNQAIIAGMKERGAGKVIHLCSSSAINCIGSAPYGAAKAALAHYSRSQGKRAAIEGVIVFGYNPGIVESPSNWGKAKTENPTAYKKACQEQPLGRLRSPLEVAINLANLCQPESEAYAGCIIHADGSL